MNATGTNYRITYTVCEQTRLMHDEGGRPEDDERNDETKVYINRKPSAFANIGDAAEYAFALASDPDNEPEAHNGGRYSVGSVERTVYTVYGTFEDEDGEVWYVDDDDAPCWNGDAPALEVFDTARDTFAEYGDAFDLAIRSHGRYLDYETESYNGVLDVLQAIRAR
jgi:hypothetical protein